MDQAAEQILPDHTSENRAAEVVFSDLGFSSFYYRVPQEFAGLGVGWGVLAEIGRRHAIGWVTQTLSEDDAFKKLSPREASTTQSELFATSEYARALKPLVNAFEAFPSSLFPVFEWMCEYYGSPISEVIDTAIPLPPDMIRVLESTKKRRGQKSERDQRISPFTAPVPDALSSHQARALEQLRAELAAKQFAPYLLHGVTGSGKTEVYIRAIEETLALGRTALVIVPEISLTPQLTGRFESRLSGEPLGVLHSQLGTNERWRMWERIRTGEIRVVIGARSGIFAPLSNVGLIIVDEEHESSYKQSESLRYHARDLAVVRAKMSDAVVLLGSATPAFESLYNVVTKRYKLLEMPERVTDRALPAVEVVDMNKVKRSEMVSANISPRLYTLLCDTLTRREQAILLYNRRGFSSFLQCGTCGEGLLCPHCSVTLTYHRHRDRTLCHYCDYTASAPKFCPRCRDLRTVQPDTEAFEEDYGVLQHRGSGTERVVSELQELFPTTRLLQMDRDTVGKKDSHRDILEQMRAGKADLLVGTQMIAKGHDLPGVTLVGIIDADVGLHLPDFRASEKSFQLITQASGRAGRGDTPGRVLIQTREPNHPTIVAIATGRFKAFARYELDFRRQLSYPPYGKILRVVLSSTDQNESGAFARTVAAALRERLGEQGTVLGPAAAPLQKIRGRYRCHLLVKSASARVLSQLARELRQWKRPGKELRVTVDLDPQDML